MPKLKPTNLANLPISALMAISWEVGIVTGKYLGEQLICLIEKLRFKYANRTKRKHSKYFNGRNNP